MDAEIKPRHNARYDFREPIAEAWRDLSRSLVGLLASTKAFQRLRHISFLGAIDYSLIQTPNYRRGNVRHSRFHHSRGVARLALDYAAKANLPKNDAISVLVAALLHDVGHSPFSHSLEPIFVRAFGLDHHKATEAIITGKTPIGRELYGVLRDQAIDVDRVLALIAGQDDSFHMLFSGPINFDTIEGVLRSYTYIADPHQVPNPHSIVNAATYRLDQGDRETVDMFWNYKNQIYKSLIHSRLGLVSDYLCQRAVLENLKTLTLDDYFSTDTALIRRIPPIKKLLQLAASNHLIPTLVHEAITYKERHFFIDSSSDFFLKDDNKRYQQTKKAETLNIQSTGTASGTFHLRQDLFDDDDVQQQLDLFA